MRSDELIDVARMLDDAGYHGVMVSDHVCYPRELKSPYPYSPHEDGRPIWEPETSWPDTWVLIGAMIGATKNLHFSNNIYIAGNRPLLVVAKQVGTAAVLSHNRVEFGLAAGWMREEFELNGQDWDNRGKRLNEMIRALRELWKPGWVEWHGDYYDIPSMTLGPSPTEPVPIHSGGHRRATCGSTGVRTTLSRSSSGSTPHPASICTGGQQKTWASPARCACPGRAPRTSPPATGAGSWKPLRSIASPSTASPTRSSPSCKAGTLAGRQWAVDR